MNTDTYNGWRNYETWCVALWLDNERTNYDMIRDKANEFKDNQYARYDLANMLKEYIEGINPLAEDATLFSDLLNAALSEVDWYEIADSYLAEKT